MLQRGLRDKEALVIPDKDPPALMHTPVDTEFPNVQTFEVKGSLGADGILKGHVNVTLRGDAELAIRSALHTLAPAQWQSFLQGMSYQLGFGGTVTGISIESVEDLAKPLHYSYDYVREHYSDWDNRRITPPSPPFAFALDEKSDKPVEPIEMESPGETVFRSSIELPVGYSSKFRRTKMYKQISLNIKRCTPSTTGACLQSGY
jgi:hypothetical protein